MPQHIMQFTDLSSSMTLVSDKKHLSKVHFKWSSIKKFIYLAFAFSSCSTSFDIFSKVMENVRVIDFIFTEITIGMTYLCMDFFIKQYTRKISLNESLNPFLKVITYGSLLQSGLWTLLHATDLADSVNFLFSLDTFPPRTMCDVPDCVSTIELIKKCQDNNLTKMNKTSAHIHYIASISYSGGSKATTRFFVIALVWVCNFFVSSVADDTILKIFRLIFCWRIISSSLIMTLVIFSSKSYASDAVVQMMDMSAPSSYSSSVNHVSYAFGIGFIGIYDFETMSPFTMTDNSVVIFTMVFTAAAFVRSLIVRNLYLVLTKCVEVEVSITPHYLMFAILPLSAEFLSVHRIYVIYIYTHIAFGTIAFLSMSTMTMSRLLHNQFRSVKNVYIIGILCFLGFIFSLPIAVSSSSSSAVLGLLYGLNVTVLYLGGFKVAIVMWVYGVHKFSTDINFWLGFKPAKFWTLCWMALPIVLFGFAVDRSYQLSQMIDTSQSAVVALMWIYFSIIIASVFMVKMIKNYLMSNNLAAAFKSTKSYGPPDPEDRCARRAFNEILRLRLCTHNCNVLDETYECLHSPEKYETSSMSLSSSSKSLIDLYEEEGPSCSKAQRRISYSREPIMHS